MKSDLPGSGSVPPLARAVLLVDDEDNIVSALKRLLRRDGYHVVTANSGAQGLQRRVSLEVPFFSATVQVIGNSQAVATVPEHIARQLCRLHDLAWRPLGFIDHSQRYWVVWHQRLQASAEHRWLRNRVFELWRQSQFGVHGGHAPTP